MEALRIKHYPRQPHTEIQIIAGNGRQANLPGRNTELTLWGSHSGMFLEINSFSRGADEPYSSEVMPFYGYCIIAKEDEPDKAPDPDRDYSADPDDLPAMDGTTKPH